MFTPNDILTLAKAGFTAQQIGALNNVGTQPAQQPAQVVQQTQQPAQVVQQTQQPAQNDMFSQIMAQLQTNAINATQQPQQQTTDDILASIINPNE